MVVQKGVHCHDRTHPLHVKKVKWWPPKCLGLTCEIVSLFTHYLYYGYFRSHGASPPQKKRKKKEDFCSARLLCGITFIMRVPPSATALREGPLVGATGPMLWPHSTQNSHHKLLKRNLLWTWTYYYVSIFLWQWISLLGCEESQIHMENCDVSLPLFVSGVVE
jgi:hypothetical protein